MRRTASSVEALRRKLASAARSRKPCRLRLREDAEGIRRYCFVLKLGPEIAVCEIIGEGGYLEGFNCVPVNEIEDFVCPAPTAAFMLRLLSARKQKATGSFPHDVSSWKSLIEDAAPNFPLTTIHIDDVCYVGKVVSVDAHSVSLHEISPSAVWDNEVTQYWLDDITRVDFGQPYEDGLSLVGGRPPKLKIRQDVAKAERGGTRTSKASAVTARRKRKR